MNRSKQREQRELAAFSEAAIHAITHGGLVTISLDRTCARILLNKLLSFRADCSWLCHRIRAELYSAMPDRSWKWIEFTFAPKVTRYSKLHTTFLERQAKSQIANRKS